MSESEMSQSGAASNPDPDPPGPPSLPYTLRTRKAKIAIFWTALLLDCCIIPVALYYALRSSTRLTNATIFALTTALTGGTLILEFLHRGHHLYKPTSTCRPAAAPRAYFDHTHWILLLALLATVALLTAGTAHPHPNKRLLALPAPTVLAIFAADALARDVLHLARRPAPLRVSTCPAGAAPRPGIYVFVEDVVATDGGGGTAFRKALDARYRRSYRFRHMLRALSLFWSVGGVGAALGTVALVWTLDVECAYGVGWVAPWVWGLVWALVTVRWVAVGRSVEYASWAEAREGAAGLPDVRC